MNKLAIIITISALCNIAFYVGTGLAMNEMGKETIKALDVAIEYKTMYEDLKAERQAEKAPMVALLTPGL